MLFRRRRCTPRRRRRRSTDNARQRVVGADTIIGRPAAVPLRFSSSLAVSVTLKPASGVTLVAFPAGKATDANIIAASISAMDRRGGYKTSAVVTLRSAIRRSRKRGRIAPPGSGRRRQRGVSSPWSGGGGGGDGSGRGTLPRTPPFALIKTTKGSTCNTKKRVGWRHRQARQTLKKKKNRATRGKTVWHLCSILIGRTQVQGHRLFLVLGVCEAGRACLCGST